MPLDKQYKAVVMGVGNILWADEGFGVRAAEAFHAKWEAPEGVEVIDGGTLGYFLSEYIENTDCLIVFDCCEMHEKPGTFRVITGDNIRPWLATKVSAHQAGLNDLFANAMLLGRYPSHVAVIGCQPEILEDYGGSLSASVAAAIPGALEEAKKLLADWGITLAERPEGDRPASLGESCLSRDIYEQGRPSEQEACRYGDPRFMPSQPLGDKEG